MFRTDLGYGAATLEGGFGFLQFFIHPYRRCIQDRIAEPIVVTEQPIKVFTSERSAIHFVKVCYADPHRMTC